MAHLARTNISEAALRRQKTRRHGSVVLIHSPSLNSADSNYHIFVGCQTGGVRMCSAFVPDFWPCRACHAGSALILNRSVSRRGQVGCLMTQVTSERKITQRPFLLGWTQAEAAGHISDSRRLQMSSFNSDHDESKSPLVTLMLKCFTDSGGKSGNDNITNGTAVVAQGQTPTTIK